MNITQSYTTGNIIGKRSGGICGWGTGDDDGKVKIANCYSTGAISGDGRGDSGYSGGICRHNTGMKGGAVIIKNVYASGHINRSAETAGIIAHINEDAEEVKIKNSVHNGDPIIGHGECENAVQIVGTTKNLSSVTGKVYCVNGHCWNDETAWKAVPGCLPILRSAALPPQQELCPPTVIPTATITPSPSAPSSKTPTMTKSSSTSPTASETQTSTKSMSTTATASASPSLLSSSSPTGSSTASLTSSVSPSLTITPTATITPPPSSSLTRTPAITKSSSTSPTAPQTPTEGFTTSSVSPSLTITPIATLIPSPMASLTRTPTMTKSSGTSPTFSSSPSESLTTSLTSGIDPGTDTKSGKSDSDSASTLEGIISAVSVAALIICLTLYVGFVRRRNAKRFDKASGTNGSLTEKYAVQFGIIPSSSDAKSVSDSYTHGIHRPYTKEECQVASARQAVYEEHLNPLAHAKVRQSNGEDFEDTGGIQSAHSEPQ